MMVSICLHVNFGLSVSPRNNAGMLHQKREKNPAHGWRPDPTTEIKQAQVRWVYYSAMLIRVSRIRTEQPSGSAVPFSSSLEQRRFRQNDRDKMNLLFHG